MTYPRHDHPTAPTKQCQTAQSRRYLLAANLNRGAVVACEVMLVCLWSYGCGDSSKATVKVSHDVSHPAADYLVRPLQPSMEVGFVHPEKPRREGPDAELWEYAERLRHASEAFRVGVLEGPRELVFGMIEDVAVGDDGRIYLLDSRFNEVRVITRQGEVLQIFGRPGQGPGEFRGPRSLAVDASGRVYVGDISRQIHVFEPEPSGLQYRESLRTNVAPVDMCVLGNRLYVHGINLEENKIIHEYDLNGTHHSSFGAVYNSPNPLVNYQLSQGRIACSAADGMIVYVMGGGPGDVRGYTSTGDLKWLSLISDYQSIDYVETATGDRVTVPENGFHHLQYLTMGPTGNLVLQLAFVTRESREAKDEFASLHTFLFAPGSGRGMYVGDFLPTIMAAGGSSYIAVEHDPYPRMRFYSAELVAP